MGRRYAPPLLRYLRKTDEGTYVPPAVRGLTSFRQSLGADICSLIAGDISDTGVSLYYRKMTSDIRNTM